MAAESVKCSYLWLLLWLCVRASVTKNTRRSTDDDILRPYIHGHGPSHSHRYVRDRQPIIYGSSTHESKLSSSSSGQPVAESRVFVTDVEDRKGGTRSVYGHMTVVPDPLRTVSVLEPGGPDGCRMNHKVSVEETAEASGCLYAQNAGFFNTSSGECLGNVVSNGRLVKDSGGVQNAQFGIRKDGMLVFGYLSQEDVLDQSNPFVQLVSGVIWLLRNSEIYIKPSLEAECNKTQETGSLQYFADVVSARTAVGHDGDGNLILFQIDGQTGIRGMNLWELAEFLKKNGVVNAINLDGGGSSTYVVNGSLASYPSDHCNPDSRWRCSREISTILCVHERRCQPANCSGHGECVNGNCRCQKGWQGVACDSLFCQPPTCGPHGVCSEDGCICDAGWRGKNCSQECLPGFYGDGCKQTCSCANGGTCDPVHGRCTCPPGFHGEMCKQVCPLGFFGLSCAQECRCDNSCPCDPQTGSCNTTWGGETNYTLHKAGHCLAKQIFTSWKQEEDANRETPYLTEKVLHSRNESQCSYKLEPALRKEEKRTKYERSTHAPSKRCRRSWLIITVVLAALLFFSLIIHLVQACRSSGASHFSERRDYSYILLSNINRANSCARETEISGKESFGLEDSESQDEVWSPPRSGRL